MDEEKIRIEPRVLSGFRDYDPRQVFAREEMFKIIRKVFETFGFDPLDTTTVEFLDVLTGKAPGWDQMGIFLLENSQERTPYRTSDEDYWVKRVALRFDLTVSLARYVAENIERLPRPFKRYQLGKVYRGEKAQFGRYREFFQFDADSMFVPDVVADAEIIAMMSETMRALGVKKFKVKVNNRKIFDGLPEVVGLAPELLTGLLRTLDKIDKLGEEKVVKELREPLDKKGLGMDQSQVDKLLLFLRPEGGFSELVTKARAFFAGVDIAEQGIQELVKIGDYLGALGCDPQDWEVDFSVVRGLSYYTGPVFETVLTDLPAIGSVFSGGRFDNLVSRFSDAKVPGTGASVGVDRLLAATEELKIIEAKETGVDCLVAKMTDDYAPVLFVAAKLRSSGINALVYNGNEINFGAQINRALKFGIPILVIVGEQELTTDSVAIKDLRTRKQTVVKIADASDYINGLLRQ